MFQFMRKSDRDKDKDKKVSKTDKGEKSSLGKKVKDKLSAEDLHRLDEIRRSFKLGKGKKEKQKLPSGIIADYSENFVYPIHSPGTPLTSPTGETENLPPILHSDSSESSLSSISLSVRDVNSGGIGPAKPPRAVTSGRTPSPIAKGKKISSGRYSSEPNSSHDLLNLGTAPSRPPTSASSSSFTPSYITPPQSPSHVNVHLSKFYSEPELDLSDKVQPNISLRKGFLRNIFVQRLPTGDFGFSLRRASVSSKDGSHETILYAEPSQCTRSRDFGEFFLLPGDKLISVNQVPVEAKNREDVIKLIRCSQFSVDLRVESSPLWIENIQKIVCEKDEDKTDGATSRKGVWIVHKNGFVSGQVLEKTEETGKCKVKLDTGQIYEVDEDDIENTNPESLDSTPQLWNLNLINESSILHILRNRFHSNLPFTLPSSDSALYLTRNAKSDIQNQRFLRQVVQPFSSAKLNPNLYSLAFQAYRGMITARRNQSIIIHGQSDSSIKKESVREILKYFAETKAPKIEKNSSTFSNSNNISASFVERFQALENLVNFFCCSSFTGQDKETILYNLEFDLGGRLFGINVQIFGLEMERVYEPSYFTVLQALHDLSTCPIDLLGPYPCLKQLRKDLLLTDTDTETAGKKSFPFFCSDVFKSSELEENLDKIKKVSESMLLLGLGEAFTKSVWSVFGAIYHLGHVLGAVSTAIKNDDQLKSSKHIEGGERHFKSACALLGLSVDRVEKSLVLDENESSRVRNVLGFSLGLYFESVNAVFTTVNKSNSVGFRNIQCLSISLAQIGFTSESPARFGDLASNYVNERINRLIQEVNFDRMKKLYKSEGIDCNPDKVSSSVTPTGTKGSIADGVKDDSDHLNTNSVLPLLDSWPSNSNTNPQQVKGKGLLFLLDEAKEPSRFLEKFESEFFGENQYRNLYAVDFRNTTLTLCHSNGNRIVEYDMKKVVAHAEITSTAKFTNLLVQESQKDNINCMFLKSSNPIIGLCVGSATSEIGLRRASSIRRNYASTWKKKTASLNVKIQADYLIEILGRTQMQFLHCLNPSEKSNFSDLDMGYLRRQIRSVNLPDAIRFYKSSYPHYLNQSEFFRKFKCLGTPGLPDDGLSVRDRIADIFNKQDISSTSYQMGNTMIFMKHWLLEDLENKRDDKLDSMMISFQSMCRGFLARRRLEKMKIRDMAVRCVQKNVRKLLAVRNWSWWKMYQQISPLIKVQSSHEKLQSAQDELASLKLKLEKAESERHKLKAENEKLEIRVNELSAELNEEQGTSAVTSERLDAEMNEKQKLEAQLAHVKNRYQNLELEKHQLELDLAYSISEVNGDATPDDYNEDSVYKQRFERTSREQEILKQRLKQREQDHLDQIMVLKKSLEKKCSDAWEETEEQRQIVAQLKRRIQKLSSELADIRCLLQEEQSRSSLLDKKQRRFDAELSTVNAQLEKEKMNKERVIRERDAALIQKDAIYNELQTVKMELHIKESKLASIETELEETVRLGGSSEQMNGLRKAKNDLQLKVKDQEEELDDLAGQVQSLEGTKIRLEMQLEQMRKEYKREIQQREEEIEDIRSSAQKKVKALECQLESEHEERTAILRSKQEFERKLFDMEELSANRSVSQEQITRLKRELKRTRALLKDAQTMLEQSKNDALGKGMLRQLRHQLEDSESQRVRLSRAKQKVEEELADVLHQLEDITKSRNEAENVRNSLLREKSQMQMQIEENEEQLAEVMRKYKASVEQLSLDQNTLSEQSMQISELEMANSSLKETIAELNAKLESLEGDQVSLQIQKRFHMKIRELETRLDLECTTKGRMEGQVNRLKEHIEKFQEDIKNLQTREYLALDKCKKSDRQLRECREEINRLSQRESETQSRRTALEKQLESADLEISTLKNDLKLAMQRIEDLTAAIKECDDVTDDEDEDSSTESVTSDTEISESFNTPHFSHLDSSGAKNSTSTNRTHSESYA